MANLPLPSNVGAIRAVVGTNPSANVECSDTVPVGANEVQTITGTPSGTFGLNFSGEAGPATLSTTATAADVQAYLRQYFSSLFGDGVSCSGGPLPSTITVTFDGVNTKQRNLPALAVNGGITGLTFATTVQGTGPRAWLLLGYSVSCVQGATQTPFPSLVVDDGTNIIFQGFCGTAAINASVTAQCSWAPGLIAVGSGASTANTGPLPEGLVLPPGYRVRTLTTGIGANTNYGSPTIFVSELGS